jgi:hypothetical protein
MHNRVLESDRSNYRNVICDLLDWQAMTQMIEFTDGTKEPREWVWGSLFTLNALEAFSTILILGNRFRESLSFKLLDEAARADGMQVEWSVRNTSRPISWKRRRVNLHHFSDRCASRFHLMSDEGRENIAKIDVFLAGSIKAENLIWTTNDKFASFFKALPENRRLKAKQAGSNEFAGCNQAAAIYTVKPSPKVEGLLKTHSVTADDWTQTNEHEVLLQFITRTSLRDPASAETVDLYVYDREQAAYIAERIGCLPHVDLHESKIDLGLKGQEGKRGRPKVQLSAEGIRQRDERARAKKAEWARNARAKARGAA